MCGAVLGSRPNKQHTFPPSCPSTAASRWANSNWRERKSEYVLRWSTLAMYLVNYLSIPWRGDCRGKQRSKEECGCFKWSPCGIVKHHNTNPNISRSHKKHKSKKRKAEDEDGGSSNSKKDTDTADHGGWWCCQALHQARRHGGLGVEGLWG